MCADFINLGAELDVFAAEGIEYLHVDVMDGHYVPNLTLGPGFCDKVAGYSAVPLDIHLMIENVDAFVPAFCRHPGCTVSFHPEAMYHPLRTAALIRDHGARVGIAIDPATSIESIKYVLPDVESVCVMTVSPGYSGQTLIPQTLGKIRDLRDYAVAQGLDIDIQVDGNVSWENIPRMIESGANVLILGTSSIYDGTADLATNIRRLRRLIREPSEDGDGT
jgi:ribulose-phosphate 3-epimerase